MGGETKEVRNRLRAKVRQKKKDEMDAARKREMLEKFAAKQGIVPTTAHADPSKGDMHPVRLKLGYGPDGKPANATLEIEVPEGDKTVQEFLRREHVKADIVKAKIDGHTVKVLEKEGVKMTVRSNGHIGEAAMTQIFKSIKSRNIPAFGGFFDTQDPGELAKSLKTTASYTYVQPPTFSGPTLEEKVEMIKAEMAKSLKQGKAQGEKNATNVEENKEDELRASVELSTVVPKAEPKQTPVASKDVPQAPSESIQKESKKNKKKNKKAAPSTEVPISCDNDISSDINHDAQVVGLSQKKDDEVAPENEETVEETSSRKDAKTECPKCGMKHGVYPTTIAEHYEFVKKTFEYMKAKGIVQSVE